MNQSRRIKAISFDGDMTLWNFQKVMRHSLAIALAELRRRAPGLASAKLTVDRMIEIRNVAEAELGGRMVSLEEIRFEAFKRTVASIGCSDDALATDLNALYMKHRFEDLELYSDVVPTLDSLATDYATGLVSNGNGYPERCGLAGRFAFVVLAQDVGVVKPEPEIFLVACEKAGCDPSELMHIGDSLRTDVAGANNVGAVSVWLNRTADHNTSGVVPNHEIRSLGELLYTALHSV